MCNKLDVKEEDEVLVWLNKLKLGHVYPILQELGASDLESLKYIEEKDLAKLKPLEIRKFMANIAKIQ